MNQKEFNEYLAQMSVEELRATMEEGLSDLLTVIQSNPNVEAEIALIAKSIKALKEELIKRGYYERQ